MSYPYSPPMPKWDDLGNRYRRMLGIEWPCHHINEYEAYELIRKVLLKREQDAFEAIMAGPPSIVNTDPKTGLNDYRVRVRMRRRVV